VQKGPPIKEPSPPRLREGPPLQNLAYQNRKKKEPCFSKEAQRPRRTLKRTTGESLVDRVSPNQDPGGTHREGPPTKTRQRESPLEDSENIYVFLGHWSPLGKNFPFGERTIGSPHLINRTWVKRPRGAILREKKNALWSEKNLFN